MSSRIMHRSTPMTGVRPAVRATWRACLVAILVGASACDQLLDVNNPSSVPEESLADPALAPALVSAALQTLQCGVENFAATAGLLSGEYWSANGFVNNHIWEWRGVVEIKGAPGNCNFGRTSTDLGFYTPLQQARFQLDDAFNRLDKFTDAEVPNRPALMATLRAYAGYAYLLLA